MSTLAIKDGRRYRPARRDEVLEAAAAYLVEERRGPAITTIAEVVAIARMLAAGREYETFGLIALNGRHNLIAAEPMFRGTINGATVYPREVVKRALELNAAAVIMFHNHPSGNAEPSEADRSITLKLSKALALVEIRLLDHVVVTNTAHVSLAERGWL